MKVLVTGATGYIGGRMIPELIELGHSVRVLVRDPGRITGRLWADAVEVAVSTRWERRTRRGAAGRADLPRGAGAEYRARGGERGSGVRTFGFSSTQWLDRPLDELFPS